MSKVLVPFFTLALAAGAHAAGFANGSFETGTDPGFSTLLAPGDSTTISGWTVGGAGIDYIGTRWTASDGVRCLDLSGTDAGSVEQTFDTVMGQIYRVGFDLAGNPQGPNSVKTLRATAAGFSGDYSFDNNATTQMAMGWVPRSFLFTATSASTTLKFLSLNATQFGPALDNVTVQAVPEPASFAAIGLGLVGVLRRRSRA